MLALVSADLGVALVPASAALLEVRGVVLRRLQHAARDEVLSLLVRRRDDRPLVRDLVKTVGALFAALGQRIELDLAAVRRTSRKAAATQARQAAGPERGHR